MTEPAATFRPDQALKWVRELQGTGACGIADLAGYREDFDRVEDACRRILALASSSPPDFPLIELLWTSAVINYVRPFGKDRRQQLPDTFLDGLSPQARETHEDIRAIRDKYIAHSENSMETNLPIYELSDPASGERKVLRVGTMVLRRGWDSVDAVSVLQLVREVIHALNWLVRGFHAEIMSQLTASDIDDLYAEGSLLKTRIERGVSVSTRRTRARDRQPSEPVTLV